MRIVSTALLTATFLGSTISLGWCPSIAQTTAPLSGSNGATTAHVHRPPPKPITDPKLMNRDQRRVLLGREIKAGNIKSSKEMGNFLATGDPKTAPPPRRELTKPANMSQASWDRFQARRGVQPTAPAAPAPAPKTNAAMDRLQGM
jgi:hypothetical protein